MHLKVSWCRLGNTYSTLQLTVKAAQRDGVAEGGGFEECNNNNNLSSNNSNLKISSVSSTTGPPSLQEVRDKAPRLQRQLNEVLEECEAASVAADLDHSQLQNLLEANEKGIELITSAYQFSRTCDVTLGLEPLMVAISLVALDLIGHLQKTMDESSPKIPELKFMSTYFATGLERRLSYSKLY